MDVKDLRTEPALSERNNDGSKYTQGGVATLHCNRNKSYQDIGSNPLAKAEGAPVRPCAVIGPDRVVPPPAASDTFLKKGSVEPWANPDNGYRRPPDYPFRLHQNPTRNISPRQTFQENMQRINVPPTYNTIRHSDSANYNHIQDRSVTVSKNIKPNMAPDAKYCEVPYAINALPNEPKNIRDSDMYVSSVNSQLTRSAPHVWPPGSVNVNAPRTYSANDPMYQYSQYSSCAGQRPPVIPMTRPHRTIQEDPAYVYPDHYYLNRLKPYPPMKERCPQPRYEYVGNYPSQFQPTPPIQPHKYDSPKPTQAHPYPVFPHFKYLDNRVPVNDPTMESYQRPTSHQPHYNIPFRTQVIHPPYAQVPGNTPQKVQHYPPDGSVKAISSNKLQYENSNKMFIDYENARNKQYPMTENYYVNEMNRFNPLKNQMVMPNYSPLGMRAIPSQQYYLKDNTQMKPFDYMPTFRNYEPHLTGIPGLRHAPQFSPNTLAISPTDSNTSNDTSQAQGISQEDCGYVSQSSTTSVRSIDSGIYRLPHEYYKRHEFRYGPIVGSSHTLAKTDLNSKDNKQKQIDVRQFLQMWNEGEEENNSENNNSKENIIQTGSSDTGNFSKHPKTEDQLYVLGLVNVPSDELSKYEHIEKISKLPENIKGYNNLELYTRFEEAMESCNNTTGFKAISRDYQNSLKDNSAKLVGEALPRSVSPLDVEAKISQSVIHKEVGCNFEIKPCSPKMLNVEVAAPAQNILGERVIEKVSNPLSKPLPIKSDENSNCHMVIRQDNVFAITDNPSCKMIRSPFSSNNMDSVKTNYTIQDLEINMFGNKCLASLPRLDNEIELNFPEVNQQFINANKKEEDSAPNNCHQDKLQDDSSLPDNKEDKSDTEKNKIIVIEPDKSFSKLSKYRKAKTSATDCPENKSKVVRTDSVIIKNPDNIENKMLENSLNIPMNLSSQSAQWYNSPHEFYDEKNCDMALDFSLNKSGNDLPMIETEKDALIEPFQSNPSHLTRENVTSTNIDESNHGAGYNENYITVDTKTAVASILTDPNNVSCIQNYQELSRENFLPEGPIETGTCSNDDNMVNSEESITECIKTASKVHNNQEAENTPDIDSYEAINSAAAKKDTDKSTSDSALSGSLILENTESECNKSYDTDQHKHTDIEKVMSKIVEISENITSEESQASVKKYNTGDEKNTVIANRKIDNYKDNSENDCEISNLAISTVTAPNNVIENMKQFFNADECCEVNRNKLHITSQYENDFEHDEISASLEKLFRESNDEISLPQNYNSSSSKSVSQCFQKNVFRHSKELYSPWIQKLLTYSEGSCSNNQLPQKYFFKSIIDPDHHIDKPTQSLGESEQDIKQEDQNNKIVHNVIDSSIERKLNNFITRKKSTKDLTSDSIPKSDLDALNQTSNSDTDSTKKNKILFHKKEIETQDTTKTLIQEHDTVGVNNHIKNDKKRGSAIFVKDSSKKKSKKRKLHISKLPKNLSNCDSEYISVKCKIGTNKNDMAGKESDMRISRKSMYDLESIIKKDLTSTNVIDFVFDDKKDQETKVNRTSRTHHNPDSGTASGHIPHNKLDTMVQHDLKESSIENVSNDVPPCISITKQQICEKSNRENDTESILEDRNNDTRENISKAFESYTDDFTVLSKQCNLSNKSVPKNDSLIFNVNREQKLFGEGLYQDTNLTINNSADIVDDKMETTVDNSNTVYGDHIISTKLCNSVIDNCTDDGNKKSKSLEHLDHVTIQCAEFANKTSGSSNITSKLHKDVEIGNDSDSLCINNCMPYQAKHHQSEEGLLETRNNGDNTTEKYDEFTCSNIVCSNNNGVVSQENQNCCNSKMRISNIGIENQTKGNKCIKRLVKSITNTPNSDLHSMSENLDSEEVYSTDKIIIQVPKIYSDCDSNRFTDNIHKKNIAENTFTDLESCKDHHIISETLENANIICKEENIFQEDQHNLTSEILSSKDSGICTGFKIQKHHNGESTTENFREDLAEVKNDSVKDKSKTINIQIDNAVQENQHHLKKCLKSVDSYSDNETNKTKIQECLETNCETVREETLEVCGSTKNLVFDYVAEDNFSDSNIDSSSINVYNDYVKTEKDNGIEERMCIEKDEIELKDSDLHTISSEKREESYSVNNTEPDSLIEEKKSDNTMIPMSDCVSDKWVEKHNKETMLLNKDITEADEEYVCCEDKDGLCDPISRNDLVEIELENHNSGSSSDVSLVKQRLTLKRSFSDSALNSFKNRDTPDGQLIDNTPMWPPKRQRIYEFNDFEQQDINENFCNFIQNRRNSISSYYNAENVSFCILIDNDCILTEENDEDKISFAEVSEECISEMNTDDVEDNVSEVICGPDENELHLAGSVMLGYGGEKSIQESWLDDVACVETVVSDDIVQDAENDSTGFSRDVEDESGIFNSDMSEITHEDNFVNEETIQDNVSEFDNTYRSPRSDDKIILYDEEPHYPEHYNALYSQCLENILSKSYYSKCSPSPTSDYTQSTLLPDDTTNLKLPENKENIFVKSMTLDNSETDSDHNGANRGTDENKSSEDIHQNKTSCSIQHDNTMPGCSLDNIFSYKKQDDNVSYPTSSSSPEVTSTTFEEKSSSILLKITNYNGSRVSEINEVNQRPRCKFTESKDYTDGNFPKRPLMTKAAQKYIPPLKESIRDLKVKLPLPQQRLLKLKQLKLSRSEPRVVKKNILTIPKQQKSKPNFEDVLKNIDETQIKMHKQNSKKNKNIIPKVVIKKNVNGSHYTSSSSKEKFNPDLTGRKWQPWVFLERNRFIDNMAVTNKSRAIYSHRKNAYVLAEKFKKYKSVSNCTAKFVISQPKTSDLSKGQLKYTIRLKHS